METLEIVNKRLLDNYGVGVEDQPRYRVVWSTSQYEMLTAIFTKTTEAGIYLGEELATRSTPKYSMYVDYWILEFVEPNLGNPELKAKYSYEPLWIFRDRNNNPLPYDWEVIEKIVYFHIHKKPPVTERVHAHDFEEQKKREEAETLDFLQHNTPFPNKMYDSKVVTVPGKAHQDV